VAIYRFAPAAARTALLLLLMEKGRGDSKSEMASAL
jgi:hypothetical protein